MVSSKIDFDFKQNNMEDDEEEVNDESFHKKLLESVANLNNIKKVKPPSRNELGQLISEYHIKEKQKKEAVYTKELADVLGIQSKVSRINKKFKAAQTLPKPLPKPVADKIKRSVGFDVAKKQLNGWQGIVESNRVTSHMVFPLNQARFRVYDNKEYFSRYDEKEKDSEGNGPEKVEFPYTLEEILAKRKEMASLRARQSYREAKAYRQSKIKSKKYHRIEKRKKLQQEMKDFEVMQKANPEAALKKLEELEKTRAEERASLKHRSTGKWAKSLAVRAKYDDEARKHLAEQLAISRDLTQKVSVESSDEEESLDPSVLQSAMEVSEGNPWSLQVSNEVNNFISGFRKYWNDKSVVDERDSLQNTNNTVAKRDTPTKQVFKKVGTSGNWLVSDINCNGIVINDNRLAKKITEKFQTLKGKVSTISRKSDKGTKCSKHGQTKAKLKQLRTSKATSDKVVKLRKDKNDRERPDLDIELGDIVQESIPTSKDATAENVKKSGLINVDPQKFIKVKAQALKTSLPDDITAGDEGLDESKQHQVIMEAFADDDVIAEFNAQKKEEEKTTEIDVVAELPGWGSWGGVGIDPSKQRRRRRRFMQIPELPNRKDHGRPDVIINEESNPTIKNHMVKEVPFPFKSVDAFESNIRTPICREWVTESSHRDLIRPEIITRMGTVIEPLSDAVLLRNQLQVKPVFHSKKKEPSKNKNIL